MPAGFKTRNGQNELFVSKIVSDLRPMLLPDTLASHNKNLLKVEYQPLLCLSSIGPKWYTWFCFICILWYFIVKECLKVDSEFYSMEIWSRSDRNAQQTRNGRMNEKLQYSLLQYSFTHYTFEKKLCREILENVFITGVSLRMLPTWIDCKHSNRWTGLPIYSGCPKWIVMWLESITKTG